MFDEPAVETSTRPPRRRRRWLTRALLALVAMALVSLLAVHLPPVQRWLFSYGLGTLAAAQGLDLTWSHAGFNLFTRSATIDGLRLGAAGAEAPLVAAERVAVRFPFGLFRGRLDGLDVTLAGGVVTLVRDDGRWITLPEAWTRSTPGAAPRRLPAFAALRLHDVAVVYEDRDASFRSETLGLRVDLLPAGQRAGELAGQLTPGARTTVRWEPRGTVLTLTAGRARFSPDGAGVDGLALDAPEGRIRSDVRFAFRGDERFGLSAHADLDASQLAGWAQALDTARGTLGVAITMPSKAGAPAFADVEVSSAEVVWRELVVTDLAAAGPLETDAVKLDRASMRLGVGSIEGNAYLVWSGEDESRATLTGRNLDVAATLRTLVPDSTAIARFAPGALASGRFAGTWRGWRSDTLDGVLDTTWRPGAGGPERYTMAGGVRTRFARGRWTVGIDATVDEGLGVQGSWTLDASPADFGRWPIGGTLTLGGATASTLDSALAIFDVTPPVDLSAASGEVLGVVDLAGALGDPRVTVDLSGEIGWPDQPPIDAEVTALVTTGAVTVTAFEAVSGPSRATSTLVLDLDRETIDGEFLASQVPVEAWLRRFALDVPAAGVVDLTGRLSGAMASPVVDAEVKGGPMLLSGQSFDAIGGRVRYGDGAVTATGVTLTRGQGAVDGQVTWVRETEALDGSFDVRALPFDLQVAGLTGADGGPAGLLRGEVGGRLALGGTVPEPTVDLSLAIPDLTLDRRRFGALRLTARTVEAATTRVSATAPDLGLDVEGTVDLSGQRAFDLTARVDTADSPLALDLRGVAIDLGAMALEARATGRLSDSTLEVAQVSITRLDGAVVAISPGGEGAAVGLDDEEETAGSLLSFSIEAGTTADYRDGVLGVDRATLTAGQTRVAARGRLGDGGEGLEIDGQGRLDDFGPLARALAPPAMVDAVLEGPFRLRGRVSGSIERPVIGGNLDLDDVRVGDGVRPPLVGVWVRVALDGEQIRLDLLEGHWQDAHFALSGMVPTWFAALPGSSRTEARATLSGHVDEITLAVLEPFVGPESLRATSFDSRLTLTLSATEPDIDAVTGELVVERAVLRSRELGLAQRDPARLRIARGVVTLDPWTLGAPWSTRTVFTLGGSVTLPKGDKPAVLDLGLDGRLDLRAIGLLFGGYRPAGSAAINLRVTGAAPAPSVDGVVGLADGELLIREPRLVLSDLAGEVRFTGDRITLEGVSAAINGGALSAGGSMRQPGRGAPEGELTLIARGMLIEAPRGLRSAIDADLTFAERPDGRFGLGGRVTVTEAAYRETMLVTGGILSLLSPREDAVAVPTGTPTSVDWLVLDLRVVADDSIGIDTTYGQFNVGANLRVQGTLPTPRITGTAAIAPGGELFVGGRRYQIESGLVTFRGPAVLSPEIRFQARTSVGGYDITLDVESDGDVTETTLVSDPPLPEEDIASLLISGQRRGAGDSADAVTQQLVGALSGEIVGAVGRAIGFDSVRVEQANPGDVLFDATLISSDTNPAQRLTFSKRVFPDLEVVISQSLRQSGDITWVLSWLPLRGLELRFVQLDDEDRSYEIRHDVSFGGGVKRARTPRKRREQVRDVQISAGGAITEAQVRDLVRLEAGDRFDFYRWQGDRDRLQRWLFDNRYYEGRVVSRRNPPAPPSLDQAGTSPVDLSYQVETGPRTELEVTGVDVPDSVRRQLARAWVEVPVDALLPEELALYLRPWLAGQGFLRPAIDVRLAAEGAVKKAIVTVEPGAKTTRRILRFDGNEGLSDADLEKAIGEAGLADRIWVEPLDAAPALLAAYRRSGYLTARVTVLDMRLDGATAELPVRVDEGVQFRAGSVRLEGVSEVPGVDLRPPIEPDTVLTDRLVAESVRTLERRFRRAGYRGTRVSAESTTREATGTTDLVFNVLLGQRSRLEDIRIAGASESSRKIIDRTLDLERGDPLSFTDVDRLRDRLYDTGVFRTVSLETTPVTGADGRPDPGRLAASLTVEELPKYRFRYGFQLYDPSSPLFDPTWGKVDPGIVADLTRRGLFGRGLTGGIGTRLNPSEQTIRAYISSRTFFGLPLPTNLFAGREAQESVDESFILDSVTRSISIDQRARYGRLLQVSYGYAYEQRVFDALTQVPPFPIFVPIEYHANIGRLLASVVFDERDDVVNTRQGPFHSSSIELGPEMLGSTRAFKKYLGQQFYFVPWRQVTFGAAARVELAGGPGRGLITTERLRVGGGTTVRGYEDDTLSLRDITTATEGTTGIVVLNQEVRFPLTRRFQGAAFWDYAHIYGAIGEFTGLRVRNSLGAGVRLLLPFIILRVDYGYPINQDDRNDRGRWYFAIGQAF